MGGCKMEEIEINLDEFNKTVNELNNIANKFNTTSTKIKNIGNSLEKNWDGKSGKALLNALFIADIGIDLTEHAQAGTVKGRNMQTCLSHQGEKAHGF